MGCGEGLAGRDGLDVQEAEGGRVGSTWRGRVFFFMRMQNAFKTFCFDGNPPPSSFGSIWFVLAPFGLKNVEILKKVLWFSNHRTRKTKFW